MTLISLSFAARVGKDTIADYLVENHGFKKTAFAGSLKEAVKTIFGFTDDHVHGHLKEVVDPFWGMTPRYIMQTFGTEACRNNIDRNIWIKSLQRQILNEPNTDWVISDARFLNEVLAVKDWGGVTVKVVRPNKPEIQGSTHSSEVELDRHTGFDAIISNDKEGDFDYLYEQVDKFLDYMMKTQRL